MVSFVINLCRQVNLEEVDLFAFEFMNSGKLVFHNTDLTSKCLEDAKEKVQFELLARGHPDWQLILIVPLNESPEDNINTSLSATILLTESTILNRFIHKPQKVSFICIHSTDYQNLHNAFDYYGDFSKDHFLTTLSDQIETEWQRIILYDKSDIIINAGYNGINKPEYRSLVDNVFENIYNSFANYYYKSFSPLTSTLSANITLVSNEEIALINKDFFDYLTDVKSKPDKYLSESPWVFLKNCFKRYLGLFSIRFRKYGKFYVIQESLSNHHSRFKLSLGVHLQVLAMTELPQFFKQEFPSEVKVNLDDKTFSECISKYHFPLINNLTHLKKLNTNHIQSVALFNYEIPVSSDNQSQPHLKALDVAPKPGYFWSPGNLGLWKDFIKIAKDSLVSYKTDVDYVVSGFYNSMLSRNDEPTAIKVEKPEEEEKKLNRLLKELKDDMKFPSMPDVINEWDDFVQEQDAMIKQLLSRLPRHKPAFITLFAGCLILCLALAFSHLPATIIIAWALGYVVLSIIVFLVVLFVLRNPILKALQKTKEEHLILINNYTKYKDTYVNYLGKAQKAKVLRKNISILRKLLNYRHVLRQKNQFHLRFTELLLEKTNKIIEAYRIKLDKSQETSLGAAFFQDNNETENPIYQVTNIKYKAGTHPQEFCNKIYINSHEETSILGSIIKKISIDEISPER